MNCSECEKIVREMARGALIELSSQENAISHAQSCPACAARLDDERALTAGLRMLALSDEGKESPERSLAALLADFRQRQIHPVTANPSLFGKWLSGPSLAVAAAAILLMFGFVIYRANEPNSTGKGIEGSGKSSVTTEKKNEAGEVAVIPIERVTEIDRSSKKSVRNGSKNVSPRLTRNSGLMIRDWMTLYSNDEEITTDFLPLMSTAGAAPMESGRLIRVQMPRSALLRFGLPVNAERPNLPVNADLLVGEDGLAHAIRFVR